MSNDQGNQGPGRVPVNPGRPGWVDDLRPAVAARPTNFIFVPTMPRLADRELPIEISVMTGEAAVAFRITRGREYQAQLITPDLQVAVSGASPELAFGNLMLYLATSAQQGLLEMVLTGIVAAARPPSEDFPEDWDAWLEEMLQEGGS